MKKDIFIWTDPESDCFFLRLVSGFLVIESGSDFFPTVGAGSGQLQADPQPWLTVYFGHKMPKYHINPRL